MLTFGQYCHAFELYFKVCGIYGKYMCLADISELEDTITLYKYSSISYCSILDHSNIYNGMHAVLDVSVLLNAIK